MSRFMSVITGVLLSVSIGAKGSPSAYESVQTATDELLAKLVAVQSMYESDREEFFREIDGSLAPFVDFNGFSRGVMAKYYRRATKEQRSRFAVTFRDSLIRTYAKALVEFDNQQVVVKEQNKSQKDPKKARVSLEIHGKDGTIYLVEYSLVLVDDLWKLRNIVINGINIGLQYRSQFSNYMQQYKNNIDEVIGHWEVDV